MNYPTTTSADTGGRGKRKSVRIAPDPQVLDYVQNVGEMSDQERFQGWWQPDEYEAGKASARSLCRKIRHIGVTGCLSDAYDRANMIAASSGDQPEVASHALAPNEGLVHWCRTNQTRGLERWTCRSYGTSRGKDTTGVKHAVLLEQARQFLANEYDEQEIARVSEEASRKSRAFAAILGQADAAAAAQPEQDAPSIPMRKALKATHDFREDPAESSGDEQPTIFISIQTLT